MVPGRCSRSPPLIEMPILVLAGHLSLVFLINEGSRIRTPATVWSPQDRSWMFASVCHSRSPSKLRQTTKRFRAGPPIGRSPFVAPRNPAIFWPNELSKAAFFRLSSRNTDLCICAGSDFSKVRYVCCPVSSLPMKFWYYTGRHFFSVQREFKTIPNCGRGLSSLINQLRMFAIMHLNVRLAT